MSQVNGTTGLVDYKELETYHLYEKVDTIQQHHPSVKRWDDREQLNGSTQSVKIYVDIG
ncbi:hypothetical protein HGO53_05780 [Wolbachia endosymbiont of Diaphorina citri]|jgi:hypothetical protein|uniref:hypothetical protein n=1 Tax=unclassified Wolbachia TaxID=2640676 RepID=UPI0002EA59AE|nr:MULTISPECIES: hypothetical protein [unclassified Wolbachia]QJT94735.1 hypothetical protein HGO48_05070 [Wolbachia endosymbiont of Diaphorina citri]QJT95974.1 hypothetical protein HGO49_05070 [Wolbachia endosymbiont of Diaphorina citri]QJT97335.1 hypothetical protein HGO53_05780 [Wolbachia endosymbiont of Diaphorina citri]QLK11631.1 hypothetical protein FK497_05130 [Wolbachia endosymbiont of Diaphorina citri]QXY86835.1 hypothetical protein GZ064_02475 [Wolbachia endosymbiont of Diaphorina ci